jgi:large subunit ribosomal protein L10
MKREHKEEVVDELTQRLKAAETLLVADYRGLTMPQIDELRSRLLASGARFTVVKNTLTRRAAEAAGADALLALLDGPSAIAFLETDGDMVAAAKALADSARETNVLEIRGGIMQGRALTAAEVETLAKLPPPEVLHGQVLGAIVAPLTALAGLLNAPLQNLVGLIDARIEQLGGAGSVDGEAADARPEDRAASGGAREEAGPAEEEAPAAEEAAAEAEPVAEEESAEETTQADATASAAEEEQPEAADSEPQEEN